MNSCYLRADKLAVALDRLCPINRVANDGLNVFVMENREGLVARLEIEDPSVAAVEGTACTEYLAAFVPAHKHDLVGLGDTERLGIGFDAVELKISADSLRDRVGGVNSPDTFKVAVLTPGEVAGRAHKRFKDLAVVRGMQADNAHTLEHRFLYSVHHLVGHVVVAHMSPPDEHVGIIEHLLRESAFLVLERCGADVDIVALQKVGDRLVDTVGVN